MFFLVTTGAKREPDRGDQARAFENRLQPGGLRGRGRGLPAPEGRQTRHQQRSRRGPRAEGFGPVGQVANSVRHRLPFLGQLGAVEFAFRDQQLLPRFQRIHVESFFQTCAVLSELIEGGGKMSASRAAAGESPVKTDRRRSVEAGQGQEDRHAARGPTTRPRWRR